MVFKKSLCPCTLDKSSISIGRVKYKDMTNPMLVQEKKYTRTMAMAVRLTIKLIEERNDLGA